jgi:hypothetical protein
MPEFVHEFSSTNWPDVVIDRDDDDQKTHLSGSRDALRSCIRMANDRMVAFSDTRNLHETLMVAFSRLNCHTRPRSRHNKQNVICRKVIMELWNCGNEIIYNLPVHPKQVCFAETLGIFPVSIPPAVVLDDWSRYIVAMHQYECGIMVITVIHSWTIGGGEVHPIVEYVVTNELLYDR